MLPLSFRRKHRGNDVAEGFCRLSLLGLGVNRSPLLPQSQQELHLHITPTPVHCPFAKMSALEEIRRRVTIDIDQLDPTIARELGPFHDMSTSHLPSLADR